MAQGSQTTFKREETYVKLKRHIITQRFEQGQRLNERGLAKSMGVGRNAVRESLLRLASEGFVTNFPGSGSIVKEYDIGEVRVLLHIRAALEGIAAKFAAEHINKYQAQELQDILRELEATWELYEEKEVCRLDMVLHMKIADICGDESLKSMIRNNRAMQLMVSRGPRMSKESLEGHRKIVELIVSGDGEKAEDFARAHIVAFIEKFLKKMRNDLKLDSYKDLF